MTEVTTYNIKDDNVISIPDDIARLHKLGILETLLLDRSTGKNILWATDVYTKLGDGFAPKDAITPEKITGANANNIRRRSVKDKDEKNALTRAHAEVFTPAWIVKLMVDEADAAWSENELKQKRSDGWQKYVASQRLEITCGEAPFLVNRYDASDGSVTPLDKRTGILSRKLTLVNENTKTRATWLKWATIALQSVYGYEFQGDNLLIARVNALYTMEDYLKAAGHKPFNKEEYAHFGEIISWNLWQMDGLTNCIPFGIAKKESVQKSLFDSMDEDNNEEQFGDCVIFDWKNDKCVEFASIRKGSDMKFDYIIGNPPYQDDRQGLSTTAQPLYHYFFDAANDIGDVVELITPARFLFNAGGTPKAWNRKMLDDAHFEVLQYFPDANSIFPDHEIKGGVAITYHDRNRVVGPIGIYTPYDEVNNILRIITPALEVGSFAQYAFVATKFNIVELAKDYPEYQGHERRMSSNVLSFSCFHDEQCDGDLAIYGVLNGSRIIRYIDAKYVDTSDSRIFEYKIATPKADGNGHFGDRITNPVILEPGTGFTHTFLGIGGFDHFSSESVLKYMKTKFFRLLLSILKITQDLNADKFKYIPIQNFTQHSDIKWSQSIADIDRQLYKKYGLSPEEIDFVETHVKAMD